MVARKFVVEHGGSSFDVDYDTDDGFEVLKFQLFSLTSIPPDQQKILGRDDNAMVSNDSDLELISDKLQLVSIDEDDNSKQVETSVPDVMSSDEELARLLQAEEEALMVQQFVTSENREHVEQRILPYLDQVLMYEDPHRQEAARKTVPSDKLEEKAVVALARYGLDLGVEKACCSDFAAEVHRGHARRCVVVSLGYHYKVPYIDVIFPFRPYMGSAYIISDIGEFVTIVIVKKILEVTSATFNSHLGMTEGSFSPTKDELGHAFLLQLLFWFKQSFRWVNSPPCDSCNNETINQGMGVASHSESLYGASRVELYRCKSCSSVTRFPRYNDPMKLLETRKGRCGEWANCFTLYCRAFGYESRLILDFTDHVWTECFSPSLGRWMHLDPCEGIYDNPLLYEKGWGKKLNYVIAISRDGVHDVTKRYTKKWHEVLSRRVLTTESALASIISDITRERRRNLSSEMLIKLNDRDKIEAEEIERCLLSKDDASISLPGRQSGDKVWRISRLEFGSDEHCSLSSSTCPVRKCVDEHVRKIYDAFFPVLDRLVEQASDSPRAIEVLEIIRKIFVSLKNSPFKARRTKIDAVSDSLFSRMFPSFGQLLDALSLKCEPGAAGFTDICLASDPVKTSLALPVAFHALDDLIQNISACKKLRKDILSWPLLKLNRICSGFIIASGEELPFGIATSAFDGTRLSKWEEPNGARGCWIIYKVSDNRMHELVSYELMSANDAPERDPMDWILEGSEDRGSSWRILDKQTSQNFDKRFQRKTFEVGSQSFLANAFRFRFLAVRDANSTSRFQIGSIDLYSRTSTESDSSLLASS